MKWRVRRLPEATAEAFGLGNTAVTWFMPLHYAVSLLDGLNSRCCCVRALRLLGPVGNERKQCVQPLNIASIFRFPKSGIWMFRKITPS